MIPTKYKGAATCAIPIGLLFKLVAMKAQSLKAVMNKLVESNAEVLSSNEYETRDMISRHQFIVKTPDCSLSSLWFGEPAQSFPAGTIYINAASILINVQLQVRLKAGKNGKEIF